MLFEAVRIEIWDRGLVSNKALYLAIGMGGAGYKEVPGLRIEMRERETFCLRVMNELRSRGTQDILIAIVDRLRGFLDAIKAVVR